MEIPVVSISDKVTGYIRNSNKNKAISKIKSVGNGTTYPVLSVSSKGKRGKEAGGLEMEKMRHGDQLQWMELI